MTKHISPILLSLTAALLLTGCGGASGGTSSFKSESALDSYDNGAYYDGASGSAYADMDDYDYEVAEEEAAYREEDISIDEDADTDATDTSATIDRDKIVYSGSMTIETLEYNRTVEDVYALIEEKGGIIQSENSSEYSPNYGSDMTAHTLDVTVRIPAKEFRAFLNGTQGIGKVTNLYTFADNITREYYDVASRRGSLRTELDRLNELLTTADTTEDLLAIMDRIASVQGDLDSLEAQLRNMDTDVAYSTITITINEVVNYSSTPESFGERIADAFVGSWHNFVRFMQNFVIFLIYALPALILIALVAAVVLTAVRFYRKKHPAKPRYGQPRYFARPMAPSVKNGMPQAMAPEALNPATEKTVTDSTASAQSVENSENAQMDSSAADGADKMF